MPPLLTPHIPRSRPTDVRYAERITLSFSGSTACDPAHTLDPYSREQADTDRTRAKVATDGRTQTT